MTLITMLLLALLVIIVVLGVVLVIAIVRVSKELQKLGDDTESMIGRVRRSTKTIQVVLPLVALVRRSVGEAQKKYHSRKRGGHGKKS